MFVEAQKNKNVSGRKTLTVIKTNNEREIKKNK